MIGILGGTFDPVHFGHLRIALELYQDLHLQEVVFIPCGCPPHRTAPHASAAQRLAMLGMAIGDQEGFSIDRRELHREGPSYMVETLRSLREEHAGRPLCLILGMDAFAMLDGWWRWQELIDLAHLVVVQRPAGPLSLKADIARMIEERRVDEHKALARRPAGRILLPAVTQLDISASQIRRLISAKKSPRYLVPDPVWQYLQRECIYSTLEP